MLTGLLARSLAREITNGAALATAGLVGVGSLLVAGQTLLRAAVLPDLRGCLLVALALLPAVLAMALPVGLLVGAASAGLRWAEGGELSALGAAGVGGRRLAGAIVGLGLLVGAVEAVCTHALEPWGRSSARAALVGAAGSWTVRVGQPVLVDGVLIHAAGGQGRSLEQLFVAAGDVAVGAARGALSPGGVLSLEQGHAVTLDGDPPWTLRFERASLALTAPSPRVEVAERSTPDLARLIGRMLERGADPATEELALYKRSALPLALPLLGLFGFCLGARGARPVLAVTATTLGWWALLRLCDQAVSALTPLVAAGLPPGALLLATATAWSGWRDR